jgi:hypothetical protein
MRSFWYPIGAHFFRTNRILRNNSDQWVRRVICDYWGSRGSESGGGAWMRAVGRGYGGVARGVRG